MLHYLIFFDRVKLLWCRKDSVYFYFNFIQPSHDGKLLRCVYEHEAWNDAWDSQAAREDWVNITVHCKYIKYRINQTFQ